MRGYQLRLLLLSVAAVVLIVTSVFFSDWFVIRWADHLVRVDLRTARLCDPECGTIPISDLQSIYPVVGLLAFWTSLPLFVVLATQAGVKLLSGVAYRGLASFGMGLGAVVFIAAVTAGYIVPPDGAVLAGFEHVTVDTTWGPPFLALGALGAALAVRYAISEVPQEAPYKPVLIERSDVRLPATPLSVNKVPVPASHAKPASQPPVEPRTKSASQAPADTRAKSASQAPLTVDVAARLGGAPLDVAIRQRPSEPARQPEGQIPVAPESGLVIRKRTPSTAPEMMPSVASALGIVPIEAAAAPSAAPEPPPPRAPETGIKYAVTTAAISSAGITATREDGLAKLVTWADIVGIVARRLPEHAPYNGTTFVDIISNAGSTLRLLPSTEVAGHSFPSEHSARARAIVQLLATMALDAQLDPATNVFANGSGKAGQLRDDTQLATHDAKLA